MANRDSLKIILINETEVGQGGGGVWGLAQSPRDITANQRLGFEPATKLHHPQHSQRTGVRGHLPLESRPLYSIGPRLPPLFPPQPPRRAGAWPRKPEPCSGHCSPSEEDLESRRKLENHTMNTRFSFLPALAARRLSRAGLSAYPARPAAAGPPGQPCRGQGLSLEAVLY